MASPLPLAISPRWRKVLRDLSSNRARTALVVLSIAVGVFAVGTVTSTRTILAHDLRLAYGATNPASATLVTSVPFDDDLVRTARHVDGVADAEGVRRANVRVKTGPTEWKTLQLTGRQDFEDQRLNKVRPETGAWPPPRRELLIERNAFALLNVRVGDEVIVETPDGQQRAIRVAGLAHDVGTPPAVFTGQVYGYATLETLEWLRLPRTFTDLSLTVSEHSEDVAHITEVADRVKRKVEQSENSVVRTAVPIPGEHPANEVITPLLLILTVLAGFSLFLSGFLVVNTVTALLTQQVPQIGVMKAIGARSGQLLGMYLGTVLVYGLLSLAVAVPLGALAGYALTSYLAGLINFDLLGFRVPPSTLALEAAIALLVPLLAALWPVVAGTRLTVREALTAQGAGTFGTGRLDRLIERLRRLPRLVLLSLRNTFRRKARLVLTLVTLTLGGAIFIAVLSVRASLITTLDAALAYWQYDVDVTFSQPYRIDQIVEEARQVPGVVAAESWGGTTVQRLRRDGHDGPAISVVAPPATTTMIKPALLQGRWLLPDDEHVMVLNTAAAKLEPDLAVGDEVVFKIGKKETTWRIVGLVQATLTGPIAYANQPAVARLTQSQGRADRLQVVADKHDAATQAALAAALKTRLDDGRLRVTGTETITGLREGVIKQFDFIVLLMALMAVLMAVVGGLGLMGTMGINVLERSREIGIMRAIGAPTGALLQIFLVEGVLIGALSWLAGAAFAYPISRLMSDGIGEALLHSRLHFTFSLPGAALWLLVVLVLAALASLLPALRAARITVRDVLAYE
jgi:putative ABC transport system permease protein